jgi:ribose 5-phosphate isomerase A
MMVGKNQTSLKKLAAANAVERVQSGMVVGLGSGSTASYAIEVIGKRLRDGSLHDVLGIPTSSASDKLAGRLGIPLTTLREHPVVDLTIDGADEVSPNLTLIKGAGGAQLYEKIVAHASRQEVIVVDESKLVQVLGSKAPLPVEVVPFGWGTYLPAFQALGCDPVLRVLGAEPFVTDEGNYVVDCRFQRIEDPARLEVELKLIPGVVETGLFIGLASLVIVAGTAGIRELRPV